MWYGKVAIVMFIFSFALTFGMYYINTLYNQPAISANWGLSQIQSLASSWSSVSNVNGGQDPNPALIFGDFITGITVLLNTLAGGGVTTVLQGIPGVDSSVILLVQIMYGSASILLWVYVVANRSL